MDVLRGYELEISLLFRMALACFSGYIIGIERENKNRFAGVRTHIIVALGSCLGVIISIYGFMNYGNYDPSRVAAQVVSGIGFLGAGVIFVRGDVVTGLTTAAGIWTTSIIGMCFGMGMYLIGVVATALVYIVEGYLIEKKILSPKSKFIYSIFVRSEDSMFWKGFEDYMDKNSYRYKIGSKSFSSGEVEINFEFYPKSRNELDELVNYLMDVKSIINFEVI